MLEKFTVQFEIDAIDISLLDVALTHKSYANEVLGVTTLNQYNERLEFLGDAVLGLIIAQELYQAYPNLTEGELTKLKARAVCEPTLAEIGHRLELGNLLLMGKGEFSSGGNKRNSNIANAAEALLAAIFLSLGYMQASQFVMKHWQPYIVGDIIAPESIDYKSYLQEIYTKNKKPKPEYKLLFSKGPDHKKLFVEGLFIENKQTNTGRGSSRKKAEQHAAEKYIKKVLNRTIV